MTLLITPLCNIDYINSNKNVKIYRRILQITQTFQCMRKSMFYSDFGPQKTLHNIFKLVDTENRKNPSL